MDIQENVEDLITHVTDYVETQKELLILGAQEKAALALSQTIVWLTVTIISILAFIFLSTALALWIGQLLENTIAGFLVVGAFYTLAAIIFWYLRKTLLQDKLSGIFINKFTSND